MKEHDHRDGRLRSFGLRSKDRGDTNARVATSAQADRYRSCNLPRFTDRFQWQAFIRQRILAIHRDQCVMARNGLKIRHWRSIGSEARLGSRVTLTSYAARHMLLMLWDFDRLSEQRPRPGLPAGASSAGSPVRPERRQGNKQVLALIDRAASFGGAANGRKVLTGRRKRIVRPKHGHLASSRRRGLFCSVSAHSTGCRSSSAKFSAGPTDSWSSRQARTLPSGMYGSSGG